MGEGPQRSERPSGRHGGRRAYDIENEPLQRQRELLAMAQKLACLGSWEWDVGTDEITWSDELYRIYGLEPRTPPRIDFPHYLSLIHPDDREHAAAVVRDTWGTGEPFDFTHRIVRPDGVERTLRGRGEIVRDAAGRTVRLVGTAQDITEQLAAEATARRLAEAEAERRATEQAHERLVAILDGIGELFIATDDRWRFTFLNEKAETYLASVGLTRADVMGKVIWETLPGLAKTRFHREALRAKRERTTVEVEEYYAPFDRWFVSRIAPTRDGFASYTRDITERKRAEATARESLELLRAVIESTSDSIYVKDVDGRYVMVNSAAARGMGRAPESIIGQDDTELFPPHLAQLYREHDQRVLAAGVTRTYEEPAGPPADDRVLLATKGVIRGDDGQPRGVVAISRDITKRKRAEEALRASEERFRTLVQSIDDLVFELDEEGRLVHLSGRWLAREGIDPARLAGRSMAELFGPAAAEAHAGPFRRALAGEPVVYEWVDAPFDGTRAMQLSLAPLTNEQGKVNGVVGVGREVSDRLRAERRQRFVAEAGALLAASLDYEVTLASVARLAVSMLCDLCVVDVFENGAVRRVAAAHRDPAIQPVADRLRSFAPGPGSAATARRVIETGATELLPEIDDARIRGMAIDDEHLALLRRLELRSSIVVPLVARGRTIGSMSLVATGTARSYPPEDVALVEELAGRAALAVDNAQLYRDAQRELALRERREAEQRFLAQASRALGSSIEYEATLASVARLAVPALADYCIVDVLESDGTVQRVELAHADPEKAAAIVPEARRYPPDPKDPRWETHPVARALRTGEPTFLPELTPAQVEGFARDDAQRAYLELLAPVSLIAVPMRAHDRTLGAITFCHADSGRRYTEASLELALDLAGRAALAVANARLFRAAQTELQQRIDAEAELRRWANIFEHAGWGVLIVDGASALVEAANPALAQMSGAAVRELVGRPFASLVAEPFRAVVAERLATARRRGRAAFEADFLREDGSPFPVQADVTAVADDRGEPLYFAVNVQDLTSQRRAEEQVRQAQKMEALGRLAGGVAHDFNNMLMIILGFSDFLLGTLDQADPRWADADEIRKAAERASALTRQLLTFGQRQVLPTRTLDLNEVIRDMERMLRPLGGERVKLVTSLSSAIGGIEADRGQIEQVVMNLALNARDAMPEGGRLLVETMNVSFPEGYAYRTVGIDMPAGDYVLLAVSDTGIGMDAETRSRIFEPFFTTKTNGQNSGLGLATVYGIVTQFEGYIWVDSAPGHGTTFKICFPRVARAEEERSDGTERAVPRGGGELVLVVEDEEAVRTLACRVLSEQGYRVRQACNGREALELLAAASEPVALVLTDVVMPEMGGQELGVEVLRRHPGTRLLYMSGYTDNEVLRRGLDRAGAVFLQKPFSPDSLAHKVREVLDGVPETV